MGPLPDHDVFRADEPFQFWKLMLINLFFGMVSIVNGLLIFLRK